MTGNAGENKFVFSSSFRGIIPFRKKMRKEE